MYLAGIGALLFNLPLSSTTNLRLKKDRNSGFYFNEVDNVLKSGAEDVPLFYLL
jgi:hypothetical protein